MEREKPQYVLKLEHDEGYVHYNPHTRDYFVGASQLGCCVFYEQVANDLLKELPGFVKVKIEITARTSADRSYEKEVFDLTHKK